MTAIETTRPRRSMGLFNNIKVRFKIETIIYKYDFSNKGV